MNYLAYFLFLPILIACGSKTAHLESKDTKTDTHLVVSGKKDSSLDPYVVTILVEGFNQKQDVDIEVYAGALDNSNVSFDWQEPGVCLVTFTQQDNVQRKILAVAMENKIGLKEIGAGE